MGYLGGGTEGALERSAGLQPAARQGFDGSAGTLVCFILHAKPQSYANGI